MVKDSKDWAEKMKNATVSRLSASLALRTTIRKIHQYKIPATKLSEKQCNEIMTPVYNIVLSKIGIVKSIPLEYRYGPTYMQGLTKSIHYPRHRKNKIHP